MFILILPSKLKLCWFRTILDQATSTVETINHASENAPTTDYLKVQPITIRLLGLPGHRVKCLCYIFSCCIFCALFFVLYFLCCIKSTSLSATASFDLFLEDFWSDSKEESFPIVGKLRMINYLVLCLCLFRNYISVRKLNFLLIFLLLSIIFSLRKWYCPIRFSISFHSHCH